MMDELRRCPLRKGGFFVDNTPQDKLQDKEYHSEIRPEYSLSPDDDLYGSPRSWSGFYVSGSQPAAKSEQQGRGRLHFQPRRRQNRSSAHDETGSPMLQRFLLQAFGAFALVVSVWMSVHSDRPVGKTVQNLVSSTLKTDYATLVLTPALARNFGVVPSSAVTVLATPPKKINFVRPLAGSVVRSFALVNPDVVIMGRPGAQVAAAADGLVVKVGESQASGNFVVIDHGNEGQTFYAQLGAVFVRPQEYVIAGQDIGTLPLKSGALTFGYIQGGTYRNPLTLFKTVQ